MIDSLNDEEEEKKREKKGKEGKGERKWRNKERTTNEIKM